MNVTIRPCRALSGEVRAPPSKAHTHRALIAGLLSDGITEVVNPLQCNDTSATSNAIRALGADVRCESDRWIVSSGGTVNQPASPIDCKESGVTLRFLIPIVALIGKKVLLRGDDNLIRRPLKPLEDALKQLDVNVAVRGNDVIVEGPPAGGVVSIRGDVSSQFVSGLLFAGSRMEDGLELTLTTPLESRSYVTLTLEVMKQHGIKSKVTHDAAKINIASGQRYSPFKHVVNGDWSSAAFMLAASEVTHSPVIVRDLRQSQNEPDAAFLQILSQMGVTAHTVEDGFVLEAAHLKGARIDIRECPDLGPILAVMGCYAQGETSITGAARLRYKESDRLSTITSELNALGVSISETDDGLAVIGPSLPRGGEVQSHSDHRIAMALSVAALGATEPITIRNAECVNKSYPKFFEDLRSLGVEAVER